MRPALLGPIFALSLVSIASAQSLHWDPIHSPAATGAQALVVGPNGTVYASPYGSWFRGRLMSSTNSGRNWQLRCMLDTGYEITNLVAVTDSLLFAWFGGQESWNGAPLNVGTYKSTDAGRTWTFVSVGLNVTMMLHDGRLVATRNADQSWLLYSRDTARTWDTAMVGERPNLVQYYDLENQFGFSDDSGLYLSADFKTWHKVFDKRGVSTAFRLQDGSLLICADSLYYSQNGGTTWQSRIRGYNERHELYQLLGVFKNNVFVGRDPNCNNVALSRDSGSTWSIVSGRPCIFAGLDSLGTIFMRDAYEITMLHDTSTVAIKHSSTYPAVFSLAASRNTLLAGNSSTDQLGGMRERTNDGWDWWDPNIDQYTPFQVAWAHHTTSGFIAYGIDTRPNSNVGIYHSGDGEFWTKEPIVSTARCIYLGSDRAGQVYVQWTYPEITTDLGKTWGNVSTAPQFGWTSLIIGLPNGDAVAGSTGGIVVSSDSGNSWHSVPTSSFKSGVHLLSVDSTGVLLAVTDSDGVFSSSDEGIHWNSVSAGLSNSKINQIAYSGDGFWLAATSQGVYSLKTGNTVWLPENDGLDDLNTLCIDVVVPGEYLVGTSMLGIYKAHSQQSLNVSDGQKPKATTLSVYPNPLSSDCFLKIEANAPGDARIRILNPVGMSVREELTFHILEGDQSIQIPTDGLAPGPYYLQVFLNGQIKVIAIAKK